MPGPDTIRQLLPLAAIMAGTLTAGVAALFHLAAHRDFSTPWKTVLAQLAAASPWHGHDLAWLALVLAAAHVVRRMLPDGIGWDILAFQGILIAGVLWRGRGKSNPFGTPTPRWAMVTQAVLRWLAILPILWFTAFVWQMLLRARGYEPDFQQAIQLFLQARNPWARLGFAFFAVGLATFAEEALFRGILLPLLVRGTGPVWGVTLLAAGFAALHADAGTFAALAVFSVALSLAYARTGSLWVPVSMHALFNGTNLALLLALSRAGFM